LITQSIRLNEGWALGKRIIPIEGLYGVTHDAHIMARRKMNDLVRINRNLSLDL